MSKNFELKKGVVAEIREKLDRAQSLVLVEYKGLNVEEATDLRNACRDAGVEYKVYKNNLVKRAAEGTQFESLANDLTGPNAFAFGYDDPVTPAKVLKEMSAKAKSLQLKAGVVEGTYFNEDGIREIAEIPSREVLIAKLLGSFNAPISNFAYLLSNIAEKKEQEA
ncbi:MULTISPECIES: 50S ribosomal protein L10 [unclassified Fusibacter]|uniref:50S ribosomal protein L10 n=1 Tax=unclassified Fusibacter TaxID=2624464 RepID=UPI001010FFE2|nr:MULTISPECIES: 50S ribosomal protein L10 [unclassified Fusibacter]MCK8061686.1 50S ribosomal protein L10 [Fusibacter sp. A2]NPE21348.1 50S ribosomal protein L10 [Fusibacter sp. A1]RXV61765.1 50S ribosomal protein L10 [Fusibacter sp. A1]